MHYNRWKRNGDPLEPGNRQNRPNGLRRCAGCRDELSPSDFYRSKARGLSNRCKDCTRAVSRRWHEQNRERSRAAAKRQRETNPDKTHADTMIRRARRLSAPSEPISPKVVFARDGWVCQLCGTPIDPERKAPDPMSKSIDHVEPLSRGGHHVYSNVQAAHLGCNMSKGARYEEGSSSDTA